MSKYCHINSPWVGHPHVFLATPTYTGSVSAGGYLPALAYSMPLLREAGIAVDLHTLSYDCHVDDARNAIVREFLQTQCTDLVFIDADVGWVPKDLLRLIQADADVVGGVYPKKGNSDFPIYMEQGKQIVARPDGLVEDGVLGLPTGFMRIRRHVLEKLWNANSHREWTGQNKHDKKPYRIIFERTFEDGRRWSGDYAFCRSWMKLGGTLCVDPEMKLAHEGPQEWAGTLGDYWRHMADIDHPEFVLGIEALRCGDARAEVFESLFRGWGNIYAATIPLLSACYAMAKDAKGPILETGSGLSTLVMALANPNIEVHSLEHDRDYYQRTKSGLDRYDIKNVHLHVAPLRDYDGFVWYEIPAELPREFALVLCDGPQQRFGRAGLFKLLGNRMKHAQFLMDDAYPTQTVHVDEWAKMENRTIKIFEGDHRSFAVSPAPKGNGSMELQS